MNLINDSLTEEQMKNKKIMKIIIIIIIVLAVLSAALFAGIAYLTTTKLKLSIDGKSLNPTSTMFSISENGDVYVAIKEFAELIGYTSYNGEYKLISEEDNAKCYIKSTNEIASFTLGLNKIYKTKPGVTNNFEYYTINNVVKSINGKLYAPMDAMILATNSQISYNAENNQITVYTLPYLATYYNSKFAVEGKYTGLSADFDNQKAILYNMFVVEKVETVATSNKEESKSVGVISATGEDIIGSKYKEIKFLENTKEFFVTTQEGNVGIILPSGKFKIVPSYESLELLDKDYKLYLATKNGKKGVIDDNGKIVLYIENDDIGIDPTKFTNDEIANKYLLFDNCIPVLKNDKWGMYDKAGNLLLPIEYSGFGYIGSTLKEKTANKVLIVPEYELIVVQKTFVTKTINQSTKKEEETSTEKYGLVTSQGKIVLDFILDEVYSITESGKTKYYLTYNNNTILLDDLMNAQKQQETNTNNQNTTNNTINQTINNTIQTNTQANNTNTVNNNI